jgi:hypothetical protein
VPAEQLMLSGQLLELAANHRYDFLFAFVIVEPGAEVSDDLQDGDGVICFGKKLLDRTR